MQRLADNYWLRRGATTATFAPSATNFLTIPAPSPLAPCREAKIVARERDRQPGPQSSGPERLTPVIIATSLSSLPMVMMLEMRYWDDGDSSDTAGQQLQATSGFATQEENWPVALRWPFVENAELHKTPACTFLVLQAGTGPVANLRHLRHRQKMRRRSASRRVKQLAEHLHAPDTAGKPEMHLCQFHELPAVDGQAVGCAWNYYAEDKAKRDQLGRECSARGRIHYCCNLMRPCVA